MKTKRRTENGGEIKDVLKFLNFLDRTPGLTYVYASSVRAWGPNLVSALAMFAKRTCGQTYEGPFPEPDFRIARRSALTRRQEIVEAVEKRVAVLKEAGGNFVLLWQAFGEKKPHLDHSADYPDRKGNMDIIEGALYRLAEDSTRLLRCGRDSSE